mgnify:CR=1 FL=1
MLTFRLPLQQDYTSWHDQYPCTFLFLHDHEPSKWFYNRQVFSVLQPSFKGSLGFIKEPPLRIFSISFPNSVQYVTCCFCKWWDNSLGSHRTHKKPWKQSALYLDTSTFLGAEITFLRCILTRSVCVLWAGWIWESALTCNWELGSKCHFFNNT